MLARLLEQTDRTVIDPTVVCLASLGEVGERIRRNGIRVESLGIDSGGGNLHRVGRLFGLLRRIRPDVLQTWLYHADLTGLIVGRLAGVRTIVWNLRCAELDPDDHPRSLPLLLKLLARTSGAPAAVIANSNAGRVAHEKLGYAPARWEIIPNGFDTSAFRPIAGAAAALREELRLAASTALVGILARFHRMKDHATFIRAAAIVRGQQPDVHFVAAGRGMAPNERLDGLAHALGVRDRLHLIDQRPDPASFLAALDVAVSASYGEAFPNVVGEAMACGTACVVTDVGDSARLVGNAGLVVPPRDPEALAAGILQILRLDPDERVRLGMRSRQRIAEQFSLNRIAARYQEVYADLVRAASTRRSDLACAG